MTEPTREHVAAFEVAGPHVRTTNRDESDPATARIGALWGCFFADEVHSRTPARTADDRNFGVYANYESDAYGAFDVTAGVAVSEGGSVRVEDGDYLVFTGHGEMPRMVLQTWGRIWQYFDAHPEAVRRFASDFEAYSGPEDVRIHIGIVR